MVYTAVGKISIAVSSNTVDNEEDLIFNAVTEKVKNDLILFWRFD